MADLLALLAVALAGGATGAAMHAAWTEARHDCMPHEPADCPATASTMEQAT